MFKNILLVGAGGFIGSVLRYLSTYGMQRIWPSTFPLATLSINILGCFLIGAFYALADRGAIMSDELRIFLTVGICGGFTTFSTFSNDNLVMMRDGLFGHVLLYTALSVFGGFLAVWLGNVVARIL